MPTRLHQWQLPIGLLPIFLKKFKNRQKPISSRQMPIFRVYVKSFVHGDFCQSRPLPIISLLWGWHLPISPFSHLRLTLHSIRTVSKGQGQYWRTGELEYWINKRFPNTEPFTLFKCNYNYYSRGKSKGRHTIRGPVPLFRSAVSWYYTLSW